jgi:hypothetical protein
MRQATTAEARLDTVGAARFSAAACATGGFECLLQGMSACPLLMSSKKVILASNPPGNLANVGSHSYSMSRWQALTRPMSSRFDRRSGKSDARAAQVATQPANSFSLSGGDIYVDYSSTSINGQPRLTYHDSARTLSFAGIDIRTSEIRDIGTIVSVTLMITPDVGSTTFSLLIPVVTVGPSGSNPVTTVGITTLHRTPLAPQIPGQREVYRVVQLTGVASRLAF